MSKWSVFWFLTLCAVPLAATSPAQDGSLAAQTSSGKEVLEVESQDSPATFKSKVNLVLVPVVVRDGHGHAVGNLEVHDFRLFDKGKPQVISKFSVEKTSKAAGINNVPSAQHDANETSGKDAAVIMPERYTAYVFDDLNVTTGDLMRVQKAAVRHLESTLHSTDRAAIYSTSGRTTVEFTDDRPKLEEGVMRLRPQPLYAPVGNECPDISYYMADLIINKHDQQALQAATAEALVCSGVPQQAVQQAQQLALATASRVLSVGEQETRVSLSVFRDVIRRLGAMPGQRSIVFVSPGFLTLTAEALETSTEILDRATRANIVINSLDARGLYTSSEYDVSQQGHSTTQMSIAASQYQRMTDMAQADILGEFADGTGGTFIQNTNDLEGGLKRIAAAPEYIYLLGFSPQNLKMDGTFHRLKITLQNGSGLTVQARRGYFAPKHVTGAEETAKTEIEDAVFSREELHELPVDLHTQFFKPNPAGAKLTVLARVDLKRIRFKKEEGRNRNDLTIVSVLFDRDGNYVTGSTKTVQMRLKDDTLEKLSSGITVRSSFDVKPGTYLVRLVVRDAEGQLMSAENGAVDIP